MASNAAAPFWRAAGMTYITYSNICANLVRNCLKEPYKTEALSREKVHFAVTKFVDGNPQKPSKTPPFSFFLIISSYKSVALRSGVMVSGSLLFLSPGFIDSDLILFKFAIIVNLITL